jgi:hypothetical protein
MKSARPSATVAARASWADEGTWWDEVPCAAQRCVVEVLNPQGDGAPAPATWYAELIGQVRPAVEVVVPAGVSGKTAGRPGHLLYIDDEGGWGWQKVTWKRGHRGVVSGVYHRVRVLDYLD